MLTRSCCVPDYADSETRQPANMTFAVDARENGAVASRSYIRFLRVVPPLVPMISALSTEAGRLFQQGIMLHSESSTTNHCYSPHALSFYGFSMKTHIRTEYAAASALCSMLCLHEHLCSQKQLIKSFRILRGVKMPECSVDWTTVHGPGPQLARCILCQSEVRIVQAKVEDEHQTKVLSKNSADNGLLCPLRIRVVPAR